MHGKELILSKGKLFLCNTILGDNMNKHRIAAINISFGGRDECILHYSSGILHGLVFCFQISELVLQTNLIVQKRLNQCRRRASSAVCGSLKASNRVVAVNGTNTILIQTGHNVRYIVRKESFAVEHVGDQLSHRVGTHLLAVVVNVELLLDTKLNKTKLIMNKLIVPEFELQAILQM